MKVFALFFSILIAGVGLAGAAQTDEFYYYNNAQIQLRVVNNVLSVETDKVLAKSNLQTLLKRHLGSAFAEIERNAGAERHIVRLEGRYSAGQIAAFVQQLQSDPLIRFAGPAYRYQNGPVRQFVGRDFIARFPEGSLKSAVTQFALSENLKVIKQIAVDTWLFQVAEKSALNGLTAANKYYFDSRLQWAQPDFYYVDDAILNSTVNDTYWGQQWAHRNTGQSVASGAGSEYPATVNGTPDADMDVDEAWDVLQNNGASAGGNPSVLIALLDSGVDLDHPDLAANISPNGKDFTGDGTVDDSHGHGTQCAGLIAAVGDNGQGVAGVAYNTTLLPVKWYSWSSGGSDNAIVQAIDYAWQNGADILSNSWGGTSPDQAIDDAFNRARTQGRGGKGCVIFVSSGNEGRRTINYPAYLSDVIAVGASNMFDEKKHSGSSEMNYKWGANFGTELALVAPTTCYTTDILGSGGFSSGDYYETFGGTSASCPNAAAVAGLVLSVDANLTATEVQSLMQNSADKIDSYPYDANGWNEHVGYGRVNAAKAVQLALGNDLNGPLIQYTAVGPVTAISDRQLQADITDAAGIASGVDAPQLWFRTTFEGSTSIWQSVSDSDGPSGSTYTFTVPGQKWNTLLEYYILAKDALGNVSTFPAGGSATSAPAQLLKYITGNFTTKTYTSSDVPVNWSMQYKSHTSSLTIGDNVQIADLDVKTTVSGKEFTVTLESPDATGSGLTGIYGAKSTLFNYTNTTFDDEAVQTLNDGNEPFSGQFQPDNHLSVFDGGQSAGTWTLRVYQDPENSYPGGEGTISNWNLDITYGLPNAAPQVSDIPAQFTNEGGSFALINLDDYVSDADHADSELSWTVIGNTALGAQINASRQLQVTIPDADWNGYEILTLTAMDPGGYTDSDTVRFQVWPVNDAPVVTTIADQTIDEGQSFTTINLDDYVSDVDNSDAELSWQINGNSELLVSIDQNRVATISTPNADWYGQETLTFQATDPGNLSDQTSAVFTVNAVNDAPVITSQPITDAYEDQLYEYQLTATDVENDVLTWQLIQGPAFLSINAQSGLLSGRPAQSDVGTVTVEAQVKDTGNATDNQQYELVVSAVNDTPQVSDIPDQTIDEGGTFTTINLDGYVSDVDNADSEISWQATGSVDLSVSISADRQATIVIPDTNWNGIETIWFIATDPGSLADSNAAVFTVNPINDPPLITSTPVTGATQDVAYNYQATATDVDSNETQTWQLVTAPAFLSISATGLISGTPSNADVGSHNVSLKISDKAGAFDQQNYQLVVDNQNDPPIVSDIPDQVIDEGSTFTSINLDSYVSDLDNADSEISWQAKGQSELTVTISGNRQATIVIPDTNWNGIETIWFIATDPGGLADSNAAVFTVNPINDPPLITSTPVTGATQDVAYNYQATATDVDSNETQTWQLVTAPAFLSISATGLISGTPSNDYVGTHPVKVRVTDRGGAFAEQDYQLLVDDFNEPPVISGPLPEILMIEDQELVYQQSNWYAYVQDPEQADQDLLYKVSGDSQNIDYAPLESAYSFVPAVDWFGADTLRLKVSDGFLADSAELILSVAPRNDAPQIVGLPDSLTFFNTKNDTLDLSTFQYDVDSAPEKLNWQASAGDTALHIGQQAARLILSAPNFVGQTLLYLQLSDDSLAVAADSMIVHVLEDQTPVLARHDKLPDGHELLQNFPNPFNPQTTIRYKLAKQTRVELDVFSALGQQVAVLVKEVQGAGAYTVIFDAAHLPSGVYFYRLRTGEGVLIRKLLLLK